MDLKGLVLGRRLANREAPGQKIGVLAGIAALGLDGLASSAYGPEAALTILMPLGAAGLGLIGPIMLAILVLLAILCLSYRQTIEAYPVNGGSYTVARENLGAQAGVLAATALILDYLLNVAVAISAGVAALVSALPALHPYTLPLCLGVLAVITLANLRGLPDASRLFAVPTYLFMLCLGGVLVAGIVEAALGGGAAQPVVAPPPLRPAAEAAGLWIVLRAFASGCTAMTGVEAVSNGVSAFREPRVDHARRALTAIVAMLAFLLAGIAYLSRAYQIGAMDQASPGYQSVLSQLTAAVAGRGAVYYVTLASILCVLCLSANTSFVDFPRVCRLLARDEFLPRGFAIVGRRLVNTIGILILAAGAGLLLAAFGGITDRLIPLFAVGAFLAFTLSQAGMARHWQRALAGRRRGRFRLRLRLRFLVNGLGAVVTGGALAIIIAAKFTEGAWVTILVIPAVMLLLWSIRRYYEGEARLLYDPGAPSVGDGRAPVVVVPIQSWNRLSDKAVSFAMRLSREVIAVHLTELAGPEVEEHERALRRQWMRCVTRPAHAAGLEPPRLMLLRSPYRRFVAPLMELIGELQEEEPGRPVAVLIPELLQRHWWQYLLHTHRAQHLRAALLWHGGPEVVVVEVPWHLKEPDRDAEDEAQPQPEEAEAVRLARRRQQRTDA